MNDFGFSRGNGAVFTGVAAEGDDVVEGDVLEVINVFGLLVGDVDAGLGHDFYGVGVEAVGFDAGGVGLDLAGLEGAGEAFGHLAAAGVAGAEEEDFELGFVGGDWGHIA